MKVLKLTPITDANLYSSSVAETDHPAWSAGTAYSVGTRVIRTTGVHRIFERLIAGTTASAPESDPANWLDVGPTNRWAMLDDSPSTATSDAVSIAVYLAPGAVGDIVLMGVVGTQVQVYSGSTGSTLVRTVAVAAPVAPATTRTVVITGLGIGAGNRVGVVITGPGAVQCAHLAVGTFSTLGQALPGCEVGITDYSVVSTDDFGATSVTVRPYSRWITGSYRVPAADVDRVIAEVESLQSAVTWWQVDGAYECLQTLGWPKSHQITYRGPGYSLVSFRLEGLSRDDAVVQAGEVLPAAASIVLQTATVYLYQRAPTAPAGPSQAITYTFAGPVIDGLHGGWQAGIPDGEGPIWIVTAVAAGNARSVALRPAQWAAPALMAQEAVNYDVEIESTNGTEFRVGQNTQTLLKAHVFRNDSEVTQDIPESWFRWRRVSLYPQPPPNDDATWNTAYASGYRQINVSVDDVAAKATFFLDIVRPD